MKIDFFKIVDYSNDKNRKILGFTIEKDEYLGDSINFYFWKWVLEIS